MKRMARSCVLICLLLALAVTALPLGTSAAKRVGDLNDDGVLNLLDYLLLKRYVLGTLSVEWSASQLEAADLNGDGRVNALDYFVLKRTILTLPDCTHDYSDGVCDNCGAIDPNATLRTFTVHVVYDGEYTDADGNLHAAGEAIAGVKLGLSKESGLLVVSGVTNEKGICTLRAPAYTTYDNTGEPAGSYLVKLLEGVPAGLGNSETVSFQYGKSSCTVGLYPVTYAEPSTPWNPTFLPCGISVNVTLPAEKTDDTEELFPSPEDESYYYYAFRPRSLADAGVYRVSVSNVRGAEEIHIGQFVRSIAFIASLPEVEAIGKEPSIEFTILPNEITDVFGAFSGENFWLVGVKAERGASYPVSLTLTLEKVRDSMPGVDYPILLEEFLTLPAGTPACEEITGVQTGTLRGIPASSELVKDEAGYYHIGSADGAYAMVTITAPNALMWNDPVVNFTNINQVSGIESLCFATEFVGEDGLKYMTYTYYEELLQAYAKLCDAKGAYVLNDQLLGFLQAFAKNNMLNYMSGITRYA